MTVVYGDQVAVRNLDLEVPEGMFVTLLGPSGCGKTTTLRAIAGLERLTSGSLEVAGRVVDQPSTKTVVPAERRDIGMVFQNYALWPHKTVRQNVQYPMRVQRLPRKVCDERVDELLELVDLSRFADRYPGQLSGGQQQRVAVARALAKRPKVMLFDEPLSNLDARLRRSVRTQLRALHERLETTSIFVTHDHEEALAVSDLVAVMLHGRIQQYGTPSEVYDAPVTREVAEFLGFENLLTVRVVNDVGGVVRVDGTDAHFTLGSDIGAGRRGTLAFRRDQVHVVASDDPRPSRFTATVTSLSYVGGRADLTLDSHGARLEATVDDWTLRRLGLALPSLGDVLHLVFPSTGIRILPDGRPTDPTAAAETMGVAL